MSTVILAEKPSQALAYASALKQSTNCHGTIGATKSNGMGQQTFFGEKIKCVSKWRTTDLNNDYIQCLNDPF